MLYFDPFVDLFCCLGQPLNTSLFQLIWETEPHRAEVVCEMEQRAYMCHLLWAGDLSDLDGASPDQIHRPLHPY